MSQSKLQVTTSWENDCTFSVSIVLHLHLISLVRLLDITPMLKLLQKVDFKQYTHGIHTPLYWENTRDNWDIPCY